jgi:ATP-dependent Lon protease
MTTALVSALTGIPIKNNVAMTGEVTIRGRVLPIGGLKEKSMAAYRGGVTTVYIPKANEPDLRDVDTKVKEKVRFIPVSKVEEILDTALISHQQETEENQDFPVTAITKNVANPIRQ